MEITRNGRYRLYVIAEDGPAPNTSFATELTSHDYLIEAVEAAVNNGVGRYSIMPPVYSVQVTPIAAAPNPPAPVPNPPAPTPIPPAPPAPAPEPPAPSPIPEPPAPTPTPPAPAPTPTPPAPAPTPGLSIMTRCTSRAEHEKNLPGDIVYIDDILPPMPYNVFMDSIYTHSTSMNGVEATQVLSVHPYDHQGALYTETPALSEDENGVPHYFGYYPDLGDAPELIITRMKNAIKRGGPRGRQIISPYITWHGHTRRKDDGTLDTNMHTPMWIGISMIGDIYFLFRDGSASIPFSIPLAEGSWTNDFTYSNDRMVIYVADTKAAKILKVDRSSGAPVTSVIFENFNQQISSLRFVNGNIYFCDPLKQGGSVWMIDPEDLEAGPMHIMDIPQAFWIDHTSDGDLVVTTLNRSTFVFHPFDIDPGPNLMAGRLAGNQKWVQCDVDRNGTFGLKDSLVVLSGHGEANTDLYRIKKPTTGAYLQPYTFSYQIGRTTVGLLDNVTDGVGHYPWSGNHHPDDGVILVQGFANGQPKYLVAKNPADPWPPMALLNDEQKDLHWVGLRVLQWGGDEAFKGTVPTFQSIINWQGGSQFCSADHVAEMPFGDAITFLRGGMVGRVPRTITGNNLRGLMYFMYRNSQRYLREGDPMINALMAFMTAFLAAESTV